MAIILYHREIEQEDSFSAFRDMYFSSKMKYLASDFLKVGLSSNDIVQAVKRAINSSKNVGLEVKEHFAPVYTQVEGMLFNDCKLSKMGYAMVLLNANINLPIVAKWQSRLVNDFLK